MAWTVSAIFREWPKALLDVPPTAYTGLSGDTVRCALFASGITPDKDAAVSATGYNTGVWTTANEKTGASEWVAKGRALANDAVTNAASGTVMYDADDLAGSASVTMSNVEGALILDDTITSGNTIADQGVCFLWFGGAQSVTSGTFSVNFNANGILRFTV
jgi:hypothetical protein